MRFSDLQLKAIPLVEEILVHPFLVGLADGNLPVEAMVLYLQQDQLYLFDFSRALQGLADKATSERDKLCLQNFALQAVADENCLYERILKTKPLPLEELTKRKACLAYTEFLSCMVATRSITEGLASVVPCFWVYAEVGRALKSKSCAGNPYQAWLDCYASLEFQQATECMVELFERHLLSVPDRLAPSVAEVFLTAIKLEWEFWDGCFCKKY